MPKKLKGDPLRFFNIHSITTHQKKIERRTLGKKIQKSLTMSKQTTERGDTLASPGIVCYAEKKELPFWFSSLGQMLQFDTIKFRRTCRTILVSSCRLKKVTIIVAFHFMKRWLKITRILITRTIELQEPWLTVILASVPWFQELGNHHTRNHLLLLQVE